MSVRILLLTHGGIGLAMLAEARQILNDPLEDIDLLEPAGPSVIAAELARADSGNGVLVLSDLGGSSPFNNLLTACRDRNVAVVSGLNLPMLIRTINYRDRALDELAGIAEQGGRRGVMEHRECRDSQ